MTELSVFRWLIVEDDPDWQEFIKRASTLANLPAPELVATMEAVEDIFERRPLHLVSVDKNIPETRGDEARSSIGPRLVNKISVSYPFVRTVIYTAYGEIDYANLAGRLGETEYKEKAVGRQNPNGLTPIGYAQLLARLLGGGERDDVPPDDPRRHDGGYILWALDRGKTRLPPVFAQHCAAALRNGDQTPDWTHLGKALFDLREHALYLAWAQACALARSVSLPLDAYQFATDTLTIERHLRSLWGDLDRAGHLGGWKRYISDFDEDRMIWREPGGAFLNGMAPLREARNAWAHGSGLSQADLDARVPALLALIDGLAYWADLPLMGNPRQHPEDPRRVQFDKIAGRGPYGVADIESRARIPTNTPAAKRRTRVYVLHTPETKGSGRPEPRLIDLHPFVSLKEVPRRGPMPCLLKPALPGREPVRVSLEDFEPKPGIPLDEDERGALVEIFGRARRN